MEYSVLFINRNRQYLLIDCESLLYHSLPDEVAGLRLTIFKMKFVFKTGIRNISCPKATGRRGLFTIKAMKLIRFIITHQLTGVIFI